ncbi:hypothetical protein HOLleu_17531 [Holothuria leucospilota]|uniref:Uncharacterized protein n=1 Tax=Holothuria leucospilota TaxID=206669 RepID=A0A9Q1C2A2_HOLLE|nr:hypothetical protein HOLleu_17528 [Holothuria leucospilota]KAJ8036877.1 hypothetical protein HOLleu_17531 [Holothuria leucospilota]
MKFIFIFGLISVCLHVTIAKIVSLPPEMVAKNPVPEHGECFRNSRGYPAHRQGSLSNPALHSTAISASVMVTAWVPLVARRRLSRSSNRQCSVWSIWIPPLVLTSERRSKY